jgi:hypothetical protein
MGSEDRRRPMEGEDIRLTAEKAYCAAGEIAAMWCWRGKPRLTRTRGMCRSAAVDFRGVSLVDPLRQHVPPRPAAASDQPPVRSESRSHNFASESEPRAPEKPRRRSTSDNSRPIQALGGKPSGSGSHRCPPTARNILLIHSQQHTIDPLLHWY